MSPEFIAILSIGATLAGTQLAAVLWLAGYVRGEIAGVRTEIGGVRTELTNEARSLREEIGGVRVEVAAVRTQVADEARALREEIGGRANRTHQRSP